MFPDVSRGSGRRGVQRGNGTIMIDADFAPAQDALDAAPLRDLEPLREPGAFAVLVREIGEDGASEVRAVFWSETSARLELFRTLALDQHRARIAREAHS